MKVLKAVEYEILRGVRASGTVKIPLARKPVRVATLIDEQAFLKAGILEHNRSVFLEDHLHDWTHSNGVFTYYSRVAQVADVVVAYEVELIEIPVKPRGGQGA